jgi:hypothetical protein
MPVTWTVDPDKQFVVLLPTDPSTIEEWRSAMSEILDSANARPNLTMLVDRRETETLTAAFVGQMTRFFAEHQHDLSGSRSAIVVNDDAGFGMGRMTQMKAAFENPDSTIRVFRSYEDAVRWLTTR